MSECRQDCFRHQNRAGQDSKRQTCEMEDDPTPSRVNRSANLEELEEEGEIVPPPPSRSAVEEPNVVPLAGDTEVSEPAKNVEATSDDSGTTEAPAEPTPPVQPVPVPIEIDPEEQRRREAKARRRRRKRQRRQERLRFSEARKNELLSRYLGILEKRTKPNYIVLRENGVLRDKVEAAYKVLENCELCERKCHVNRTEGELGYCRGTNKPEMFVSFAHHGDEDFLAPSYTVFFTGCNMACQFCQNYQVSQRIEIGPCQYCGRGEEHRLTCDFCKKRERQTVRDIEETIDGGAEECKTIQFIGGEPTPSLPFILDTLQTVQIERPIIWKSNFYFSVKTFEILKGVVDVWLTDWKFGNDHCATRLAKVPNYTEVMKRNHKLALSDENAVVVLRHLVMPNHVECCTEPILDYVAETWGQNVVVNLMDQYQPCWNAVNMDDIRGIPSRRELKRVYKYADRLNLVWISH